MEGDIGCLEIGVGIALGLLVILIIISLVILCHVS